ncbi:MAG: CoA pyrophosphatase [Alphaproteobacteria bacterium]|nr:CoA pyrophosphatase [Alphaproteobacteria bacterium]
MLHDDTPLDQPVGAPNGAPATRRGDHDLNDADMRPDPPLVPAAVLVPLVERDEGYTVLLTQRAADLSKHAGQISFPGGRIEDDDPSPELAALREAEEEIGLTADYVDVIGDLDIYEVRTGFEVFPIVGLVRPGFDLTLDQGEVADVFEVPLSFVLDPGNHHRQGRTFYGKMRYFYVLPFEDRYIWGATAGMLINLYEVLSGEKAAWR